MISIDQIKQLRESTGISISECQKALKEAKGDPVKAREILKKWGKEVAEKKKTREVKEGIVEIYLHPGGKVGVMILLRCESDFVTRSEDFRKLAHELCLQIAAMEPTEDSLMEQPWIKDESRTIKDLMEEYIAKLGENICVEKFVRYEL